MAEVQPPSGASAKDSDLLVLSVLVLLTLLFGAYGVSELREAWRYGTSTHDGVEALSVGALFLAILVVVVRLTRKRRPRGLPT